MTLARGFHLICAIDNEKGGEDTHATSERSVGKAEGCTIGPTMIGKSFSVLLLKREVSDSVSNLDGAPYKKEHGYQLYERSRLPDVSYDQLLDFIKAEKNYGILHRDTSIYNIRGEKASRIEHVSLVWEPPPTKDCIGNVGNLSLCGNWAFMSILALVNLPDFRYSISDEMESLLYVVLYCCVRWLPHEPVENLDEEMEEFFDRAVRCGKKMLGGATKAQQKLMRYFTRVFLFLDKSVGDWVSEIYELMHPREYRKASNWEPVAIEGLWCEICSRNLPDGDRVEHI